MDNELISIIIPVKNGKNYLQEALDHIKAQEMNVEVIVIDDASEDETSEIASRNGCRVFRQSVCQGQVTAKNIGVKMAKGDFILFHDHDDRMRTGALRALYEAMDEKCAAVMAKVQDFYTPGMSEQQKMRSPKKEEPFYGLFTGAVLIRKSAMDLIGPFNPQLNTGEILEWETRMSQNGLCIKKIDLVATDRRIHATNYGKTNREKEFRDYAMVLRARIMAAKGLKR